MICFPLIKVACNFVFLRNGRLEVLLEETAKVIHHQAAERCFQEGQPRFPASAAHFCVPPCSTPVLARLVRRIIQGPTATEEGLLFFLQSCFSAVLAPWTGLLPVWAGRWGGIGCRAGLKRVWVPCCQHWTVLEWKNNTTNLNTINLNPTQPASTGLVQLEFLQICFSAVV